MDEKKGVKIKVGFVKINIAIIVTILKNSLKKI